MTAMRYERPWLYPEQEAAIFCPERYAIVEASPQPLDATVYTPDGPTHMGDLTVGELVCTPSGVARIAAIHPMGEQPIFRLMCNDGTSTRATGDHRWILDHYTRGPRVCTTREIAGWTDGTRCLWRLPSVRPLQYLASPVPLDPWFVGLLIGDGCLASRNVVAFSTADADILERVRLLLAPAYEVRADESCSYRYVIRAAVRGAARVRMRRHIRYQSGRWEARLGGDCLGRFDTRAEAEQAKATAVAERYGACAISESLHQVLDELDLLGKRAWEKRIPAVYRYNSEDVRLAVLSGVLDSDGHVGTSGSIVLDQTSEALAVDVQELVEGLGGIARLTREDRRGQRPSYRLNIRHQTPSRFVSLQRKRARCRDDWSHIVRKITRVEPAGVAQVQCIELEGTDVLYLTDHAIPTHNTKSGKTAGCMVWLAEQAMQCQRGRNVWWVAPSYNQAEMVFDRLKRAIPRSLYADNQTKLTIELVNGATVCFKTAENPDKLYGEDVYAVVIDEATRCREESWHAIRSTLTATGGPVRIIGNVKGRKNWAYKLARKAEAGAPDMHYARITAREAVKAGIIPASEVDDARSQLPAHVFKELYEAVPSDDEGNPFGLDAIRSCLAPLSDLDPVIWGWDLAKSRDWSVGIALDRLGSVCRFERFQQPWRETIDRIRRVTGRCPAVMDSTGVGDAPVETLQREGEALVEGFKFTSSSKQQLMEGLAVAIQRGEIRFPDGPIRAELDAFEYEYTRTGVRYSAPSGQHDDCVCALALAVSRYQRVDRHTGDDWLRLFRMGRRAGPYEEPNERDGIEAREDAVTGFYGGGRF